MNSLDTLLTGIEKISSVKIFVGDLAVNCIELFAEIAERTCSLGRCGTNIGKEINLFLEDREYLIGVFGSINLGRLTSFGIITNRRKVGPFGSMLGNQFEINHFVPISRFTVSAKYGHLDAVMVYCSATYNPTTTQFKMFLELGDYRSASKYLSSHRKDNENNDIYQSYLSNEMELWSTLLFTKACSEIMDYISLYQALYDHPLLQAQQKRKADEILDCFDEVDDIRVELSSKFSEAMDIPPVLYLKITCGEESKRIQLSGGSLYSMNGSLLGNCHVESTSNFPHPDFDVLCSTVLKMFPNIVSGSFSVQYMDDEGDSIVVGSDAEFKEAVRILRAQSSPGDTIHFQVVNFEKKAPSPATSCAPSTVPTASTPLAPVAASVIGGSLLLDFGTTLNSDVPREDSNSKISDDTSAAGESLHLDSKSLQDDSYTVEDISTIREGAVTDMIQIESVDVDADEAFVDDLQQVEGEQEKRPLYDMTFVSHCTFPDGSVVQPGSVLLKTWRVRNNGQLAWPSGTAPVMLSTAKSDGPSFSEEVRLEAALSEALKVGEETELSVHFDIEGIFLKIYLKIFNFNASQFTSWGRI